MSITRSTRVVNVGRLKPIPDHFRARSAGDPGPPCPQCGSDETFWFTGRLCGRPALICHACIESAADGSEEGHRHG